MWIERASFGEEETASRRVFASLYLKQEVQGYSGRPLVLPRGLNFQIQGRVFQILFTIFSTTFLADSSTAYDEASHRGVHGMTGVLPVHNSSTGLFSQGGPKTLWGGPLALYLSHCQRVEQS